MGDHASPQGVENLRDDGVILELFDLRAEGQQPGPEARIVRPGEVAVEEVARHPQPCGDLVERQPCEGNRVLRLVRRAEVDVGAGGQDANDARLKRKVRDVARGVREGRGAEPCGSVMKPA